MAATPVPFFSSITAIPKLKSLLFHIHLPPPFFSYSAANSTLFISRSTFRLPNSRKLRRYPSPPAAAMIFPQYPVFSDACATVVSGFIALSVLRVWQETAKGGLFDQMLPDEIVNTYRCSSGYRGAILAAVTPGINIIRMFLVGSGIWKDEATVKSMSRYGDYRELLKGPLYYAATITLACALYWRTSPIAIAAICNLCAGDGIADIVGRRFGGQKLPYNKNKSVAGSVAMATAGFFTSVVFMYYFSYFGYIEESMEIVLGFLVVSVASALVESHPISTELDDNLTVTLTSILVGSLVF
ncbi:probable phytol kinase 3, chloroplastic isoform X2 [Hibiscus syriacus]|uniref:probable phytol kinase 3, chloroplastic isoform X2 n=1 Tax=Hibiscus syriacus TaxID=106335 RepID=UPI0019219815|nr:probable phytol kinase 3, chloroplastic isoform X2 [Hibiscus syriacus]